MHFIQTAPVILLAIMFAWHLYSWHFYGGLGSLAQHAITIVLISALASASLFLRNPKGEAMGYIVSLTEPVRPHIIGASCLLMGAAHFIGLIGAEPIFLQLGFMVLILAYSESAGIANRFIGSYSGEAAPVTASTIRRLAAKQFGTLAMVFVMSLVLLFVSLVVIVGFTATWTVALFAAMMILSLAFLTKIRNI